MSPERAAILPVPRPSPESNLQALFTVDKVIMHDAQMSRAGLTGANLRAACLEGDDVQSATLEFARLDDALTNGCAGYPD